MKRFTFLIVLQVCGILGILAGPTAREAPATQEIPEYGTSVHSGAQSPSPMHLAAWHWKPSASVGIRQAAEVHFDYRHEVHDWKARRTSFKVDGEWVEPAVAARRLQELPVLTWWNLYCLGSVKDAPPDFSSSSIAGHAAMVAQARQGLRDGGLSEFRLDRLLQVFDDEDHGPFKASPFAGKTADGDMVVGKDRVWEWPINVPHAATSAYLLSSHLAACSWDLREPATSGAGGGSYNITHRPDVAPLGGPPYFRATPIVVPGAYGGDVTFISLYTHNGPGGTLTQAEAIDVIAKAQAPLWLAINNHQPGRVEILRAAKASGKVRLILFWMPHADEPVSVQEARLSQDLLAAELRTRR